jgi:hypothetical protein
VFARFRYNDLKEAARGCGGRVCIAVYHFSPPHKLPRPFLDPSHHAPVHLIIRIFAAKAACAMLRNTRVSPSVTTEGDCFAKAHISTAQTPPRQDARFPFAHEDRRWPQGPGGSPQEGTPSPHARINPG